MLLRVKVYTGKMWICQNCFTKKKKIEKNHVPGLNTEVVSSWRLKVTAGITLLSLQTGDKSSEPKKAKSNTSKMCLLYSQGNLVKNMRRKIVVVLEILKYWCWYYFSWKYQLCSCARFYNTSQERCRRGPRSYWRASHN